MKVAQLLALIFSLLPGFALAGFQGTEEEMLWTIARGEIPADVLPPDFTYEDDIRNLRFAREPQRVGQRCGRNTFCEAGVECLRSAVGSYCIPANCMNSVFDDFINKYELHDWPQQIVDRSGFAGVSPINATTEKLGIGGLAKHTGAFLKDEYRMGMANAIQDTMPPMEELLVNMVSQCPQMATSAGITLMLGGQYEIAAVATWINSFYIGIGTGNINFNIANSTSGVSFAFNVSGAVYSDLCGGGGPNAGVELGFQVGAAITGTSDDLLECSFLFDFDAGVGSSFGVSAGVTGTKCIPKFFITQGFGVGVGAGFMGCGTITVAPLTFSGRL